MLRAALRLEVPVLDRPTQMTFTFIIIMVIIMRDLISIHLPGLPVILALVGDLEDLLEVARHRDLLQRPVL